MKAAKPSLHMLTIWRIRLLFITLIPAFISACFINTRGILWALFTFLWIGVFLYFYIFYCPIKWKKMLLSCNDHCLLIHCGVIYTRVKAIPYESILYVVTTTTPLLRFFGLISLVVHMAGTRAFISGLTPKQAEVYLTHIEMRNKGCDAVE